MQGEEITNNVEATSQDVTNVTNDTNTVAETTTQAESNQQDVDGTQTNAGDSDVENSNQNEQEGGDTQLPPKPTIEELQTRLKEYEVRDEEERMIREKLGISDMDSQTYNYMNIEQQVINMGKQDYLRLCNEYGVDADPNKLDSSLAALKESDPVKAYEFQRQFDLLSQDVISKREAIRRENTYYEVSKFGNDYAQILNAAPALNNIMTQYVQTYANNSSDMYRQLQSVMDIILPAYQEAFNAGKQYALQDKAKKDTSGVQGGVATVNTQSYTPGGSFTREQISRMTTEEFSKYEKDIMQQMREGKIH